MPTVFGKYILLRRLAEGGMAELFLARRHGPGDSGELLVVKRILPRFSQDPEFVRLFVKEARIACRLSHPNVVRVDDLGRVHDVYFIAMEFVDGEDLGQLLLRLEQAGRGALPLGTVAHLISGLCEGLDYAHRATDLHGRPLGIVHRDVNPENVLVTVSGEVKIVDFGVAWAAAFADGVVPSDAPGKVAYMAPEQVRGEVVDLRADVFSVGVLLWELLCGRPLFRRAAHVLTMRAVLEGEIPPPSTLRKDAPPALDGVASRALARQVGDRYPSCAALAAALCDVAAQSDWDTSTGPLVTLLSELRARS
jgi:serine/threonine protein kinase